MANMLPKFFQFGPTKKIVALNTGSQLLGKGISSLTSLAMSFLIAQRFGASGFGDYTKVIMFVTFFFLVSDFGFNALYLQKRQSLNTASHTTSWDSLFGLRLVVSSLLVFIALSLLSFLPYGKTQGYTSIVRLGIIIFSPAIVFQGFLTSANALFQKHLRYDLSTIAVAIGSVLALILIWLTTYVSSDFAGPVFTALSLLIGWIATGAIALLLAKNLPEFQRPRFQVGEIGSLFFASIPLGLTLLFNLIFFHIDSVILTLTRPTIEVGIYGFAYKVFEVPLVIPTFFMNTMYPLLLKTREGDSETNGSFQKLLQRSFVFLILSSFVVVAIVWYAAPLLTIIRPEFFLSILPLRILALGIPLFFATSVTMWGLIALRKQNALVFIYGFAMVINIILNSIFIPRFGYLPAAWITIISEIIILIASGMLLIKYLTNHTNK